MKKVLTFIGHASMKIKTEEGAVIYIGPDYKGDYSEEVDLILVTHEHQDHNQVGLCKPNDGCKIIRAKDAINKDGSNGMCCDVRRKA